MARRPKQPPATTMDAREAQLISLAYDVAEQQMLDGSVQGQVLTHFLKIGSTRERLEQEKLRSEGLMLSARIQQIESQARIEELYAEAMHAFRDYSGQPQDESEYHE